MNGSYLILRQNSGSGHVTGQGLSQASVQANRVTHMEAHAEDTGPIRDSISEQPELAQAGPQLAGPHKEQHPDT